MSRRNRAAKAELGVEGAVSSQGRDVSKMPDDRSKTRPQDASRINIHEQYEVEYWSKKFGVTAETLKAAVGKAGTSAEAVERELTRR